MSKHDDWFDDYMIMQMMEEDDYEEHGSPSSSGTDAGCLPVILWVLAILWLFSMAIG